MISLIAAVLITVPSNVASFVDRNVRQLFLLFSRSVSEVLVSSASFGLFFSSESVTIIDSELDARTAWLGIVELGLGIIANLVSASCSSASSLQNEFSNFFFTTSNHIIAVSLVVSNPTTDRSTLKHNVLEIYLTKVAMATT